MLGIPVFERSGTAHDPATGQFTSGSGGVTVKTKNEIIKLVNDGDSVETNLRHALIFKRFPNGRADVEAMLAEQSEAWKQRVKLVEGRADQIIDEMILGDCNAALEALRSFESEEF